MKPFNLKQALEGEPVKDIHNGEKCWLIGSSKLTDDYIFQNEEGECFAVTKNIEDICKGYVMWEEPRPRMTFTLPCPLKEPQEDMWFIHNGMTVKSDFTLSDFIVDPKRIELGVYFATQEDAQEWLDAMQGAKR